MGQIPSEGKLKAILFDVDGTLVDSVDMCVAGLSDTFERYGTRRPSEEEVKALVGRPLSKQMNCFMESTPSPEKVEEMISFTIDRYGVYEHLERTFQPAIQALQHAYRIGIKTALVTSKNQREIDGFIHRFAGKDSVDVIVCASDVTNPKPDPESAFTALEKLGVRPEEAVFVGDSVFDLRCAREAGVASIAVTYGAGRENDLVQEEPQLVLHSPEELLDWIKGLAPIPCPESEKIPI